MATAMTTAGRISGVAPLAVFFDAVEPDPDDIDGETHIGLVTNVIQPDDTHEGIDQDDNPIMRREYAELHYKWNFGDDPVATWTASGKTRNEGIGYVSAHVFEDAGSYTVTLSVLDVSDQTHEYEQEITVTVPDTVYAGETFYVSLAGDDEDDGSIGSPFLTWAKGMATLFASAGPRRVLFNRGDTFASTSSFTTSSRTGPYTIGAYGVGANPLIQSSHSDHTLDMKTDVEDVRIVGIDFDGDGPGAIPGDNAIEACTKLLVLGSRISHHWTGINQYNHLHPDTLIVDCDFEDMDGYHVYYKWGKHVAILGCLHNDSNGAHLIRCYITNSLIAHNELRGGYTGMAQLKFVGFKEESPWEVVQYTIISDNLFNVPDSAQTHSVWIGPQDQGNDESISDCIFERNTAIANESTYNSVNINARYVTVRNNVFDGSNRSSAGSCKGFYVFQRGTEPAPVGVQIYNNTGYRLASSGNPNFYFVDIAATATDTVVKNNFASGPGCQAVIIRDAGQDTVASNNTMTDTPGWVDAGSNFHLESDSVAVDDGATLISVREDFDGTTRPSGLQYDLGAYEYIAAAEINTRNRRASAGSLLHLEMIAPNPDGAISAPDRAQVSCVYRGFWAEAPPTVGGPYDTAAGELYAAGGASGEAYQAGTANRQIYTAGAATGDEYSAGIVTRQIHAAGVSAGEVNT